MVSLDARNQFIDDLRQSEASCFALALVFKEKCASVAPITLADRVACSVISNDQGAFRQIIEELKGRKVKAESDWVLDDFLLFGLLLGEKKFGIGSPLCRSIIGERRPSNDLDIGLNDALRSLSYDAMAVEGAFSFVKLVFCDLVGRRRIDSDVARVVYRELTNSEMIGRLSTFPRLLAYRAFDILVVDGIEEEIDSTDAIVAAIEARAENMSIRDWWKIVSAMRPTVLCWLVGAVFTLCSFSFGLGWWLNPGEKTDGKGSQGASAASEENRRQGG